MVLDNTVCGDAEILRFLPPPAKFDERIAVFLKNIPLIFGMDLFAGDVFVNFPDNGRVEISTLYLFIPDTDPAMVDKRSCGSSEWLDVFFRDLLLMPDVERDLSPPLYLF